MAPKPGQPSNTLRGVSLYPTLRDDPNAIITDDGDVVMKQPDPAPTTAPAASAEPARHVPVSWAKPPMLRRPQQNHSAPHRRPGAAMFSEQSTGRAMNINDFKVDPEKDRLLAAADARDKEAKKVQNSQWRKQKKQQKRSNANATPVVQRDKKPTEKVVSRVPFKVPKVVNTDDDTLDCEVDDMRFVVEAWITSVAFSPRNKHDKSFSIWSPQPTSSNPTASNAMNMPSIPPTAISPPVSSPEGVGPTPPETPPQMSDPMDVDATGNDAYARRAAMTQSVPAIDNNPGYPASSFGTNPIINENVMPTQQVNQASNIAPQSSGMEKAMRMMQAKGWQEGTGLGPDGAGRVTPLEQATGQRQQAYRGQRGRSMFGRGQYRGSRIGHVIDHDAQNDNSQDPNGDN